MYAKVFSQIYDGTLCTRGPWQALVTFQQMLVLADQGGAVDMTASAISRRTTIPLDIIEIGIAELLKPDAESRTPTHDGKRIIPLAEGRAWGWLIVNYVKYRQLKREEDRREYHRAYWHKRNGKAQGDTELNNSTPPQLAQPNQPIAEAEAEANTDTPPQPTVVHPPKGDAPKASKAKRAKKEPDADPTLDAFFLMGQGVDKKHAVDWLKVRKAKKAPLTQSAWDAVVREAKLADITAGQAVQVSAENGWQGFKASWYAKAGQSPGHGGETPYQRGMRERYEEMTGRRKPVPAGEVIDMPGQLAIGGST